jgi:hypothetical protein
MTELLDHYHHLVDTEFITRESVYVLTSLRRRDRCIDGFNCSITKGISNDCKRVIIK